MAITPRKRLRVLVAMSGFTIVAALVLVVFAIVGGMWQLALVGGATVLVTLPLLLFRLWIMRSADAALLDREAEPERKTVSPFRFRTKG